MVLKLSLEETNNVNKGFFSLNLALSLPGPSYRCKV